MARIGEFSVALHMYDMDDEHIEHLMTTARLSAATIGLEDEIVKMRNSSGALHADHPWITSWFSHK
jgi:hypothetical protein